MGFEFSNNFPYTATEFPSMIEHVDPVNHTYFSGLMTELANIENTLGLLVNEGFLDVKEKLEKHSHTGGVDGAPLFSTFMDPPLVYQAEAWKDVGSYSGASCGFLMYEHVYFPPGAAHVYMQTMDVNTGERAQWVAVSDAGGSPGCCSDGTYIYFTHVNGMLLLFKFNPADNSIVEYDSGETVSSYGSICYLDGYIYFTARTTPAKLYKFKISNNTFSSYAFDSGQNLVTGCQTDGQLVYVGLNGTPVNILKYDPAGPSHDSIPISPVNNAIKDLIFAQGSLWLCCIGTVKQFTKIFTPVCNYYTIDVPDCNPISTPYFWQNYLMFIGLYASDYKSVAFIPGINAITNGPVLGSHAASSFLIFANNYLFGGEDTDNYEILRYRMINSPLV